MFCCGGGAGSFPQGPLLASSAGLAPGTQTAPSRCLFRCRRQEGPQQGDVLQGPRALTDTVRASLVTSFSFPSRSSRPRRKVRLSRSESSSVRSTASASPESTLSLQVSPGLLTTEPRCRGESLGSPKAGVAIVFWMLVALALSASWAPGVLLKGQQRCVWSRRKHEGQITLLTWGPCVRDRGRWSPHAVSLSQASYARSRDACWYDRGYRAGRSLRWTPRGGVSEVFFV